MTCIATGGSSSEVFSHLEVQTRVATQRLYRRLARSPSIIKLLSASPTGYSPSSYIRALLVDVHGLLALKSTAVDSAAHAAISPEAYRQVIARNQQIQMDVDMLAAEVRSYCAASYDGDCIR
jgi:hypothetical protein